MQHYSFQFSRNVVNNFTSAKARGWHVFSEYCSLSELEVTRHFMMKRMDIWEAFKKCVCRIEQIVRLPGPKWTHAVWVEQLSRMSQMIALEKLLNKRLVLTTGLMCDNIGSTLKPKPSRRVLVSNTQGLATSMEE